MGLVRVVVACCVTVRAVVELVVAGVDAAAAVVELDEVELDPPHPAAVSAKPQAMASRAACLIGWCFASIAVASFQGCSCEYLHAANAPSPEATP